MVADEPQSDALCKKCACVSPAAVPRHRADLRRALPRARALARALHRSHYALPAAAGMPAWRIRAAGLVRAPHPPACGLLPLSLVDTELYMIGGPCCGTLFFREALDCDRLRGALAQLLDAYPVLGGRVVSLPPGGGAPGAPRRTGEWRRGFPRAVDCNNAGAAFTVLDLPGVALPEDRNAVNAPPFPTMWQARAAACRAACAAQDLHR
jgi:hypothetical protein